jgi:ketosteroid isomerase-like protein
MNAMTPKEKAHISDIAQKINDLWINNKTGELYNYLSNDVVFASPGFHKYLKGKDLCINSYKEFMAQATIRDFQIEQINVDMFNDIAIATYHFSIEYDKNGQRYSEKGYELMAFREFDNQWLLIWRTQMPVI